MNLVIKVLKKYNHRLYHENWLLRKREMRIEQLESAVDSYDLNNLKEADSNNLKEADLNNLKETNNLNENLVSDLSVASNSDEENNSNEANNLNKNLALDSSLVSNFNEENNSNYESVLYSICGRTNCVGSSTHSVLYTYISIRLLSKRLKRS